jgi:molybdopterin-guanine dinucleotide biosynthesis protein A
MSRAPLYGLVLAGGESRRMGRDKATLAYRGLTQLTAAHALLGRHCVRTFVSVRQDQTAEPTRAALPTIVDGPQGRGPIAGIAAAQAAHPGVAWLVVACDLPFIDDTTLERLVAARGRHPVTAYRSTHDGLPEPLCAIYEPETRGPILDAIAAGRFCPRKFVTALGVPLLAQPDPSSLDNVNTPDEYAEAARRIAAPVEAVRQGGGSSSP